ADLVTDTRSPTFTFVNSSGNVIGSASQLGGGIFALPIGFLFWSSTSATSLASQSVGPIDDAARPVGAVNARGRTTFEMYEPVEEVFVADANGGAVVAGTLRVQGQPNQRRVTMFDAAGNIRGGPTALQVNRTVFGMGVDANGRVLVIQDGYAQCSGCILGQWFERNGAALTGSFTLIAGFSAGPATWFETAPVIGGGLAVRRMDARASGQLRGFTSTWLLT